jgi:hypothetical protein
MQLLATGETWWHRQLHPVSPLTVLDYIGVVAVACDGMLSNLPRHAGRCLQVLQRGIELRLAPLFDLAAKEKGAARQSGSGAKVRVVQAAKEKQCRLTTLDCFWWQRTWGE